MLLLVCAKRLGSGTAAARLVGSNALFSTRFQRKEPVEHVHALPARTSDSSEANAFSQYTVYKKGAALCLKLMQCSPQRAESKQQASTVEGGYKLQFAEEVPAKNISGRSYDWRQTVQIHLNPSEFHSALVHTGGKVEKTIKGYDGKELRCTLEVSIQPNGFSTWTGVMEGGEVVKRKISIVLMPGELMVFRTVTQFGTPHLGRCWAKRH